MPTQASLLTTSPEAIVDGTEITLVCNGVTIAEIQSIDYDEDDKLRAVKILGQRRVGQRRGEYEGKGTIKSYYLNSVVRSIVMGLTPSTSGGGSTIYHSQRPFQRYDIVVSSTNPSAPNLTFKNVVLEKDAVKFAADKLTEEDINFTFEDIIGN